MKGCATFLLLLAATAADAQSAEHEKVRPLAVMTTVPRWAERPTPEEIAAAVPPQATGGGVVNLSCAVMDDGRLSSCHVQAEAPPGVGFGEAALRLAARFRVEPGDVQADPVVRPSLSVSLHIGRPGERNFPCLPPSCVAHHALPEPPRP